MKRSLAVLTLVGLPLALAACGDSPEKVANDFASEFNKVAAIIEGVTDETSAKAAVAQLEAFRPRIDAIGERMKKLKQSDKPPSPEIAKNMLASIMNVGQKMEDLRRKNRKAAQILEQGFNALDGSMKNMGN